MDAFTYDQQRIDECCIHVIAPGGAGVSFCRFNVFHRGAADRPAKERCHAGSR